MKAILARQEVKLNVVPIFLFSLSNFFKINKETILKWMQDANLAKIEEGNIEMIHCIDELFDVSEKEMHNFRRSQTFEEYAFKKKDIKIKVNTIFFFILTNVLYIYRNTIINNIVIEKEEGNYNEELNLCLNEIRIASAKAAQNTIIEYDNQLN